MREVSPSAYIPKIMVAPSATLSFLILISRTRNYHLVDLISWLGAKPEVFRQHRVTFSRGQLHQNERDECFQLPDVHVLLVIAFSFDAHGIIRIHCVVTRKFGANNQDS